MSIGTGKGVIPSPSANEERISSLALRLGWLLVEPHVQMHCLLSTACELGKFVIALLTSVTSQSGKSRNEQRIHFGRLRKRHASTRGRYSDQLAGIGERFGLMHVGRRQRSAVREFCRRTHLRTPAGRIDQQSQPVARSGPSRGSPGSREQPDKHSRKASGGTGISHHPAKRRSPMDTGPDQRRL